MDYRLVKTTSS